MGQLLLAEQSDKAPEAVSGYGTKPDSTHPVYDAIPNSGLKMRAITRTRESTTCREPLAEFAAQLLVW